jgi:two-component system, OmpR family, phosphate regulon sensor histidine kinase PhoR
VQELGRLPAATAAEGLPHATTGPISVEEAKLRFLLRVSEELRRPLAVLVGYLDMVQDGTIADAREALPILVGKASELNQLIGDLLERARDERW